MAVGPLTAANREVPGAVGQGPPVSCQRVAVGHNGGMAPHRLLALLASAALLVGCTSATDDDGAAPVSSPSANDGTTSTTTSTTLATTTTTTPPPPPELPRGGREIFPDHRVVAHYGNAESAAMGVLGETPPSEAAEPVEAAAEPFTEPDRPVLPAFELIVSVAQRAPGPNGNYSLPTPDALVLEWLEAARAADMLLILDIQPGTSEFLPEVQRFEQFLREPDVGLALDPEWRMPSGQVPGQTIGTVDAAEINEVSEWLAEIVEEEDLPEKLFLLHIFTESMITNVEAVEDRPGLATVFHVDGFGGRQIKLEKYEILKGPYARGFKLFLDEDTNMFEPADVLAFDDPPDLITYQ